MNRPDLPQSQGPKVYNIRAAESQDLSGIVRLLSDMHETPIPISDAEEVFEAILATPGRQIIVAEREHVKEIIGTLDLFIMLNLTRDSRPWAGIENLMVDKRYRREGAATALMLFALQQAKDANCYKVQLISHKARHEAHNFYQAFGFTAPVEGYRVYLE